jgi:hypothetical protein
MNATLPPSTYTPEEIEIYRKMTPQKKLELAAQSHLAARRWKKAGLIALHPEWTESQLNQKVRELFLHGNK